MILAETNWGAVGYTTGLFVTSVIGLVSLIRGFRTDKNTNVQQAIELALSGNKDLVGNLRAEVTRYRAETAECHTRCDVLEDENQVLRDRVTLLSERVQMVERRKDVLEAENIALHRRLGDFSE